MAVGVVACGWVMMGYVWVRSVLDVVDDVVDAVVRNSCEDFENIVLRDSVAFGFLVDASISYVGFDTMS